MTGFGHTATAAALAAVAPTLAALAAMAATAYLRTEILDFRGFDSSRILILRGGIPRPIGNSESLSQEILAGIILVGRLCAFKA